MGWVKEVKQSSYSIFNEVVAARPEWRGIPDDSSSAYEYFTDYLRDNYDLTLWQCDEICTRLREYYGIEGFYAINN